ncbi:MAG: hypothetical protein RLZZ66_451 [Pseudomonadota bacterium]
MKIRIYRHKTVNGFFIDGVVTKKPRLSYYIFQ